MGVYLNIGFIAEAKLDVPEGVSTEEVLDVVSSHFCLEAYNLAEDGRRLVWSLKPDVVSHELVSFTDQVYSDFYGARDKKFLDEERQFISQISNSSHWLQETDTTWHENFSLARNAIYESVELSGGNARLWLSTISLGSEGKFLMESYGATFRFIENCAAKAYAAFKLGASFRVFLL